MHCCPTRASIGLFRAAGADGVSVDIGLVQDLDAVGTAVEAGTQLLLGVVPGADSALPAPKATAWRVQGLWRPLGFPVERLAEAVTLTPACGLAGATPAYARGALAHVREAARYLQVDRPPARRTTRVVLPDHRCTACGRPFVTDRYRA